MNEYQEKIVNASACSTRSTNPLLYLCFYWHLTLSRKPGLFFNYFLSYRLAVFWENCVFQFLPPSKHPWLQQAEILGWKVFRCWRRKFLASYKNLLQLFPNWYWIDARFINVVDLVWSNGIDLQNWSFNIKKFLNIISNGSCYASRYSRGQTRSLFVHSYRYIALMLLYDTKSTRKLLCAGPILHYLIS